MAASSELRVTRYTPRADELGHVPRYVLWALTILALGVSVALPEQSTDAALGVAAVAATILAFIQPLIALPLLLLAVPFGTRGSSGDTSTDPTIGAAELLVALLMVAWLARGVRRRELKIQTGGILVVGLGMALLAGLSIGYAVDRS